MKNPILSLRIPHTSIPDKAMRGGDFTIPLLEDEWFDGSDKELEAMDTADRYWMEADTSTFFFGFRVVRTRGKT